MMHPDYFDAFSLQRASVTDCSGLPPPLSSDMKVAVYCVENILSHKFKDKLLLEEALTHSSYVDATSYERLEFIGDAILNLAFSNYIFLAYPEFDPGQMSVLRETNLSNEKLARVAVKHGFYRFLRHNCPALDDQVREFAEAVSKEDNVVVYGGSVKAPKVLADIVESIAAAIYIDINFNLEKLWTIFRGLLEPIVTPEHLKQQPQPVTMLFHLCQKHGKKVDFKHWKKNKKDIVSVYVDGIFVASGSSKHTEIARLNAAREALDKLSTHMPINDELFEILKDIDGKFEIEEAKRKLHELCCKKKWSKPTYKLEREEGPSHDKKFVSSVQIATPDGKFYITGDEKSRVKDAENSASCMMIWALYESTYLT